MTHADWSWDDVRLFLAALRARTLTGAARELGVNQSTVSRRIAALEEAMGARLFDRVRDGLEPTAVALDAVATAEVAEAALHTFAQTVAGRDSALVGVVRLAVPDAMDSLLVVPELPSFYEQYPRIVLEVVGSASLANLARREADLALRFVRPSAGEVVVRRLVTLTNGVWAREGARDAWILGDEGGSPLEEEAWLAQHVRDGEIGLRVNRMEARFAAVQAGLGRAILPDAAGRRIPGLVRVADLDPPACPLWLVAHTRLYGVPRVRAVWDFLAKVVPERLGDGAGGTVGRPG